MGAFNSFAVDLEVKLETCRPVVRVGPADTRHLLQQKLELPPGSESTVIRVDVGSLNLASEPLSG